MGKAIYRGVCNRTYCFNKYGKTFNCVNNKMLEYDWLLTPLFIWLNWLFHVQTVRLRTLVIGQAKTDS